MLIYLFSVRYFIHCSNIFLSGEITTERGIISGLNTFSPSKVDEYPPASDKINRHYTDFKESGSCIFSHGLYFNRKLCKPQAIIITTSLNPLSQFRYLSFTIRQRFIPLMTCSIRTRMLEISLFCRFSSSLKSLPLGFFFGCNIDTFSSSKP